MSETLTCRECKESARPLPDIQGTEIVTEFCPRHAELLQLVEEIAPLIMSYHRAGCLWCEKGPPCEMANWLARYKTLTK